jgi:ATP-dependent Lon protease
VKVTEQGVDLYLGRRVSAGSWRANRRIGVATGLAATMSGGDVLFVETTVVPGKGRLILTGKLGEVMQESAQAALTYARSRAGALKIPIAFFDKNDLHIHAASAIPRRPRPV